MLPSPDRIEIGTHPGETMAARLADIEAIFADCQSRLPGFSAEIRINVERDPFRAEPKNGRVDLFDGGDRSGG